MSDTSRALVLLLHGIPSSAPPEPEDRGYSGLARDIARHSYAAAWVNMRAVRGSEGYFSVTGWVRDAQAALEAARDFEGLHGLPVALVGSSAGGAVAAEATRRGAPVDALALLASPAEWLTFTTDPQEALRRITQDAGMQVAPEVLEDPGPWSQEFGEVVTEDAVADLEGPILLVHGTADDVVPVSHAYRIARSAKNAEVKLLPGAGHHLRTIPEVVGALVDWLGRKLVH
jgi:pimeloyl-ACP methyl ester carboxylesterase